MLSFNTCMSHLVTVFFFVVFKMAASCAVTCIRCRPHIRGSRRPSPRRAPRTQHLALCPLAVVVDKIFIMNRICLEVRVKYYQIGTVRSRIVIIYHCFI